MDLHGVLLPERRPLDATTTTKGVVQLTGDLDGSATSPSVKSLKGISLPASGPATGQVLTATGTTTTSWQSPATQQNANWNASSGVSQILNKPTLATVATSGSYDDLTNRPTIPTTIDALSDVDSAGATDGQSLVYNSGVWGPAMVASGSPSVTDATSATKGVVQLAGDLGGTAASPTVPGLASKADATHTHSAADLTSGTVATARLGSGTASGSTYLRGDGTWATPPVGTGESNTASNVGATGVGVFKQKTGANLEFKNVTAASNKLTVTNNTTDNTIDLNVNEANFSLTKAQVGLGNVDNTSDLNKPLSTATTSALAGKAALSHGHVIADLPAGLVMSTSTTTRPTARTDIVVLWTGSDPGAAAINGDVWLGAP